MLEFDFEKKIDELTADSTVYRVALCATNKALLISVDRHSILDIMHVRPDVPMFVPQSRKGKYIKCTKGHEMNKNKYGSVQELRSAFSHIKSIYLDFSLV